VLDQNQWVRSAALVLNKPEEVISIASLGDYRGPINTMDVPREDPRGNGNGSPTRHNSGTYGYYSIHIIASLLLYFFYISHTRSQQVPLSMDMVVPFTIYHTKCSHPSPRTPVVFNTRVCESCFKV
jgi:hypothetical protein